VGKIEEAAEIARAAGLRYVYAGNVPSEQYSDTRCPGCGLTVLARRGMHLRRNEIVGSTCPSCHTSIAGVWS
jgi:pyruvate formate lyase activating enzyme